MPAPAPDSALLTALTTEHFVLQSAVNGTIAEASARSTLYVMALSSSLVALGFTAEKEEVFTTARSAPKHSGCLRRTTAAGRRRGATSLRCSSARCWPR